METKNSNKKLKHSKQYLTYNISPSTAVQVAYLHASYSKTSNFVAITTAYGEDAVALVTTQLELHAQAIQKSKEEFMAGLTGK